MAGMTIFFGFLALLGSLGAVGIAVLIVWAVGRSGKTMSPVGVSPLTIGAQQRETPMEILARRFASGEITAEEYQRARDLLGGGGKT
jgi:uncharacterized membrane protein